MLDDDIYDADLDADDGQGKQSPNDTNPPEPPEPPKKDNSTETKDDDASVKISKEDAEYLARARDKEARDTVVNIIKSNIPSFDENKVFDKILEMEAKEPGSGALYYNRVGMEALWLRFFDKNDTSDNKMDNSRGGVNSFNVEETVNKINAGKADTSDMSDFYTELGKIGK
ncbi:hypothetical protein CFT12S00416_05555 [Campylobacter fetus subsp. testudinum]|uniref:hypothetical protein n=1 Tax=Campylobacter fetus TaxID=196 RepID=UPI0008187604|nr:hypothetical protein [Campylobacter fetus]OCR88890.1 hypothetical protein CFT12S00416_05555 [Campylobacter fetus subsp. testudinum]